MESYFEEFGVNTKGRIDFRNITGKVLEAVRKSGIRDGIVAVFTPHTTVGLFVNEDESGLKRDLEKSLSELLPENAGYLHDAVDDNAHAHLRSIVLGPSLVIPLNAGRLLLGTWQSIFLAEFDGPRHRRVYVKILGSR